MSPTEKPDIGRLLAAALTKRIGKRPRRELVFHPNRKWRFDLSYPSLKIAIEIDGRQHLRYARHRRDCEKRNAAIELGWTVLTYPASCVLTKCRLPLIVEQIYRVVCHEGDATNSAHVLNG